MKKDGHKGIISFVFIFFVFVTLVTFINCKLVTQDHYGMTEELLYLDYREQQPPEFVNTIHLTYKKERFP